MPFIPVPEEDLAKGEIPRIMVECELCGTHLHNMLFGTTASFITGASARIYANHNGWLVSPEADRMLCLSCQSIGYGFDVREDIA